ncbi:hypothetical protein G7Z17_g2866 [Cylindrodendrum hubeiense]|uniref:Uncharacterized protein n=1 Tax=Cylindrodendrum hubeiense TaxID=595255 RepID=A0A9P5LKK2_9HYPO|nr:hypothetical protein G7Z17_g2866 [Cylindrodendrum hubeiense]
MNASAIIAIACATLVAALPFPSFQPRADDSTNHFYIPKAQASTSKNWNQIGGNGLCNDNMGHSVSACMV